MAWRHSSWAIHPHIRRQHATANSRNFRSLALPRTNSNIGVGSVQASHSASVMASLLPEQKVYDPATPDVRPRTPTVVEDVGVGAARCFEGVGQDVQAVEGPVVVDALGQ